MSFEADLKSHLQGGAAVAALLQDRFHPLVRPEGGALPAATYTLIYADPLANLDGMDGSLRNIRVQIDTWAQSFSAVVGLADAIRSRMNTAASTFTSVVLPTQFDDYEPDTRLYRRMQEFSCWYTA